MKYFKVGDIVRCSPEIVKHFGLITDRAEVAESKNGRDVVIMRMSGCMEMGIEIEDFMLPQFTKVDSMSDFKVGDWVRCSFSVVEAYRLSTKTAFVTEIHEDHDMITVSTVDGQTATAACSSFIPGSPPRIPLDLLDRLARQCDPTVRRLDANLRKLFTGS